MHLGLLWVLFEKFGASLLAVVAFFVYAKFLGPSDLGVVVIVLSVTQFLAILIGTLFEDVLVQKKELDSSDTDTAFWAGFGLSFLSMLATVGGFYFFSEKVETYNLTALAAFACLEIFLVNAGTIYVAQMRREGRFKLLALRVLIGRVGGSLLGLGAIFIGLGAWSVIIQSVMMAALQTLILILSAKSVPGRQFDAGKLKYFFSFGAFLALKRLSWDALVRITPLAAGATLGTSAAGLVGFAWRIVELFRSSIASGLMSYLVPHLSRMQDDLPRMGREFQSITALIAFFVTPVFLGLFAIAPYMITTIFD
ncbi:MAG: oligosaccharide flippase family protein, partial [Rhodospirillales bacterium]|nr:oligosaccharide flippase family protein [Rhodospirillales bacterium]